MLLKSKTTEMKDPHTYIYKSQNNYETVKSFPEIHNHAVMPT